MIPLKSIMLTCLRGYRRRATVNAKQIRLARQNNDYDDDDIKKSLENTNMDVNELMSGTTEDTYHPFDDYEDLGEAESDFSKAAHLYDQHKREEVRNKELLKLRIVTRKYCKSTDPNLITLTEKEQIQMLHNQNSAEWTPEVLSESFPALPETIRKILRSKWSPKTVEAAMKYDKNVINNWKNFKAGNLAVSPKLQNHLMKFKNREIQYTNLETLAEKFVQKTPVFPKPNSQTFTNILADYVSSETEQEKIIEKPKIPNNTLAKEIVVSKSQKDKNSNKRVTFDAFLDKKMDEISNEANLSLSDHFLLKEYKEQKNIEAFNNFDPSISQSKENDVPSNKVATVESKIKAVNVPKIDINTTSVDTGILEWKKKPPSSEEDYPAFIKVPRAKAKSGVTYKVQDRYYDCDGEFLYRVPGLK